jgi:hypothetical protein
MMPSGSAGRITRYLDVYTTPGLEIAAHEDGTLELTWKAGRAFARLALHEDAGLRQRFSHL